MGHHVLAFAVALLTWAPAAMAAELIVKIKGGRPSSGQMLIGAFDKAESFLEIAASSANAPVGANGQAQASLNLDPGKYAIAVTYDLNRNGQMDRSLFGFPTEPFGFSRNARAILGPPKFAKAAFVLSPRGGAITITLDTVD